MYVSVLASLCMCCPSALYLSCVILFILSSFYLSCFHSLLVYILLLPTSLPILLSVVCDFLTSFLHLTHLLYSFPWLICYHVPLIVPSLIFLTSSFIFLHHYLSISHCSPFLFVSLSLLFSFYFFSFVFLLHNFSSHRARRREQRPPGWQR